MSTEHETPEPSEIVAQDQHDATECDICYPPSPLTDLQRRAIELTVQGVREVGVAQLLKIHRSTLWRWKSYNYHYRQALEDARDERQAAMTDRYQDLVFRATEILAGQLDDQDKATSAQAARTLVSMSYAFRRQPLPDMPMPRYEPKMG